VIAKIKNGELVITLPVELTRRSSKGKTIVIATTRGVRLTNARFQGRVVSVAAKAFIYADRESEEMAEKAAEPWWGSLFDPKDFES